MAHDMQEIQKATCSSCGTTFLAENAQQLCVHRVLQIKNNINTVAVVVDTNLNLLPFFILSQCGLPTLLYHFD